MESEVVDRWWADDGSAVRERFWRVWTGKERQKSISTIQFVFSFFRSGARWGVVACFQPLSVLAVCCVVHSVFSHSARSFVSSPLKVPGVWVRTPQNASRSTNTAMSRAKYASDDIWKNNVEKIVSASGRTEYRVESEKKQKRNSKKPEKKTEHINLIPICHCH